MAHSQTHVGIVGAGIGGLAAGIAIARAGATVTILEATVELGEIGAGIQVLFVFQPRKTFLIQCIDAPQCVAISHSMGCR